MNIVAKKQIDQKRILNLQLSDCSSDEEEPGRVAQFDQHKVKDFKSVNDSFCREDKQKNIFEERTPMKKPVNKFQVELSDDS